MGSSTDVCMPAGAQAAAMRASRGDDAARTQRAAALVRELTHARARGLDDLEQAPGAQHAVETPELEQLARGYTGDQDSDRVAVIRRLLDDALLAWHQAGSEAHAAFVRRLFFAPDGGTPGTAYTPTDLMKIGKQAHRRSDYVFDKHRPAIFRLFAAYLIDFVAGDRAPTPLVARPAAIGSGRWSLTDLAFMAAAAALTVVMVINSSGGTNHAPTVDSASAAGAVFRFDALGGGSKVINVFPGVHDTPADKTANGTFADGQTATALCTTTGRLVTSAPSAGERPRQSDVWLKVLAQPGKTSYAVLTYGDIDQAALKALPSC